MNRRTFVFLLPVAAAACGATVHQTMDDATITARVKTALLNDPQVHATGIDVNTANGVVTISGTVPSPADIDRAVSVARQVNGVKNVVSQLRAQH